MSAREDRLDLLLADADERRPVLDEGLPGDTAQGAPRPRKGRDANHWRRTDADRNDLTLQRWAVIAPEGREGDRMMEAVQPLVALREGEQGAPARVYRVPQGMDAKRSADFRRDIYWSEEVAEEDRPLYLMMLGDLHHTSLELQHALANDALAGRIHFADSAGDTDLAGYAAYAEKVVRYARRATPEASPDLLFYVTPDGSAATVTGKLRLVGPSLATSTEASERGKLPAASVREISAGSVDELLAGGGGARPSVLLSVSHGLGAPRRGWRREEDSWRRQGALVIGHDEILDAERLRGQTFLPGGMWFYLACLGAGTPAASAYHTWLSQLAQEDRHGGSLRAVLHSLPASGQRPFVAALPQAALANPAGPLAIIGHVDLAWTYSFSSTTSLSEGKKSRIYRPLEVLVRGSRAGVALEALMELYRGANDELAQSYQIEADARAAGRADPTDRADRAHLWMLRNDLRGYVLLGDPAARLPLQQLALRAEAPAPAPAEVRSTQAEEPAKGAASAASAPAPAREAAVLAMIRGDEAPRAIAARAMVSLETLWTWVDAYRAGGRERLGG
ncbi:hypothetical protein [Sorangium sp. So ce1182]|uniref:hypothetical protein n=1 Tax=Sorangium sp. So ce1182 TaxID=3133334 RepID=UPI003F60A81A